MARSSECTEQYAQKGIDSADIVREAMFQQLTRTQGSSGFTFQVLTRKGIFCCPRCNAMVCPGESFVRNPPSRQPI